ncbi:MAG: hypothetical protein ACQCXQ_03420 [Verrucomicrobiales bacterium]|nr:hypothetical protein [Verrucomicrobiota bacterium JB025]
MIKPINLIGLSAFLVAAGGAQGAISIHGSATGYQSSDKDWLSNTVDDIDGNGLGTDGFIFFGDFDDVYEGNVTWGGGGSVTAISEELITYTLPSYVTAATIGADAGSKIGQFAGYEAIDSPVALDGTDVACGNITVTGAGEVLNFTISGLSSGTVVRVGLLGAVLNDDARARFDAPTIGLNDGSDTVYVTELPNLSDGTAGASLGWVFFDIDSNGDYSVLVPPDATGVDPDVTGFGGMTFDTIPEPSSALFFACTLPVLLTYRRRSRR